MRRLAASLLAGLALAGAAHAATVTVFAAASLKEALDEAARGFEAATRHRVVASYAASNALARQIAQGAPAELFVAADEDWAAYVERRGLAAAARTVIATNALVLVAPSSSTLQLKLAPGVDLRPALGARRLALANPDAVPAGKYARTALARLGAWDGVAGRIAATDNVRVALALVARGEAPLGVVYRSDALAEPRVRIVDTFPAATHPPIVYPMLQLARASPAAAALAAYLASPAARAIFARHGFGAP